MFPADDPPPPEAEFTPTVIPPDVARIRRLIPGITASLDSTRRLLAEHTELVTGSPQPLRFNDLAGQIIQGAPVELNNFVTHVRCLAEQRIHVETKKLAPDGSPIMAALRLARDDTAAAVVHVAQQDRFNPVREYLESVRGHMHGGIAIRQVGAALGLASEFDQRLLRNWAVSAVARAMRPGCQVDTVLVLVGRQGVGKSSFFRMIAEEEFYGNTRMDLDRQTRDSLMQLHAAWIYEWAELASMRAAQMEDVKNFVAATADTFRAPYAAAVATHPRRTVIVGTTNEPRFLRDSTGERRFWPVTIRQVIDRRTVEALRDSFWADALERFEADEPYWFEAGDMDEKALAARHETHREVDIWEDSIRAYIAKNPTHITTREALRAIGAVDDFKITKADEKRAGSVLRSIGFRPARRRVDGKPLRVWVRSNRLLRIR